MLEATIARVRDPQGQCRRLQLYHRWPVRQPRPYQGRNHGVEPLITGQRILDTFFPLLKGGKAIGRSTLTQVTVGLQLGGQVYSEFIFFKDDAALANFQRGNYEAGAQASAVAVTAGASADADYDKGVAIFTHVGGGLMAEASVGGQKFTYEPK